jgi:hypothetical protein
MGTAAGAGAFPRDVRGQEQPDGEHEELDAREQDAKPTMIAKASASLPASTFWLGIVQSGVLTIYSRARSALHAISPLKPVTTAPMPNANRAKLTDDPDPAPSHG